MVVEGLVGLYGALSTEQLPTLHCNEPDFQWLMIDVPLSRCTLMELVQKVGIRLWAVQKGAPTSGRRCAWYAAHSNDHTRYGGRLERLLH